MKAERSREERREGDGKERGYTDLFNQGTLFLEHSFVDRDASSQQQPSKGGAASHNSSSLYGGVGHCTTLSPLFGITSPHFDHSWLIVPYGALPMRGRRNVIIRALEARQRGVYARF